MVSKRELIGEVLKDQAINNLELLYDELIGGDEYLAKDLNNIKDKEPTREEVRKPYKSDNEIIRDKDHYCVSCKYKNTCGGCGNKKFKNWQEAYMECISQDHKYWEG